MHGSWLSIIVVILIHGTLGGGQSYESYYNSKPTNNEFIGSIVINGGSLKANKEETVSTRAYSYYPMELIRAVCIAAPDWYVAQMKYWTQNFPESDHGSSQLINNCEGQVTGTNYEWPVMFRRLQSNMFSIRQQLICDLSHKNKSLKLQIQVTLSEIGASEESTFFVVNNLFLYPRPLKPLATKTLEFVYEYYDGEEINLELKTERLQNTIIYSFCTVDTENSPNNFSVTGDKMFMLLEKRQSTWKIFCQLQLLSSETINAVIIFISDTFLYEPYVAGLSLSKTLKKYKSSRTTTVIHYEINPVENFKFTCYSDDMKHKLMLHFKSQHWTSHKYHQIKSYIGDEGVNQIEAEFQLALQIKLTLITCKSVRHGFNYTTKLYIHRNNQYNDLTIDSRMAMSAYGNLFNINLGQAFGRNIRGSDVQAEIFTELNYEYFEKPDNNTGCPQELPPARLGKLRIEPGLNGTNEGIDYKKIYTQNRTTDVNTSTLANVYGYAEDTGYKTDHYANGTNKRPIPNMYSRNGTTDVYSGTNKGPTQKIYPQYGMIDMKNGTNEGPIQKIYPQNGTTDVNLLAPGTARSGRVEEIRTKENQGSTSSFIFVIIGIVLLIIIAVAAIVWVIIARRQKETDQREQTYENAVVRVDVSEERASIASSHIYEVIPEPGTSPVAHASAFDIDTEVSERPPCSLPEENEDKKYVHYDTPYEFRIFRIGMPEVDAPDRFRSRRGRF